MNPSPKATLSCTVHSPRGFHLRPWEEFAKLAVTFQSSVQVVHGDTRANGTSIINLMALGASHGSHLVIEAEGPDAEEAAQRLAEYVEGVFEEIDSNEQERSG